MATYADIPVPSTDNDVLIHLAQPNQTPTRAQGEDAVNVARRIVGLGYHHVVYASSARVYGDQLSHPRRTDELITVSGPYEDMKLACEALTSGAGGTSLRFSNLYGQGQSSESVLSRVLSQIPGSDPLKVWSTAPVRDFCWIADAADAVLAAVQATQAGVFNVGTGVGTSVGDLARLALEAADELERPVFEEAPASGSSVLVLDIADTARRIGWTPATSLQAGLKQLIHSAANKSALA